MLLSIPAFLRPIVDEPHLAHRYLGMIVLHGQKLARRLHNDLGDVRSGQDFFTYHHIT